ncbi:unnamed protein product [Fraxinus pennsylvanica]|uniref:Uncharacterized protein n=1 Tax=Fraxinus pennsylvanica TaxID=56036 RepID=A0AAD2DTP6_9LAMI|nr:unnamed protein product [Fraxinus pennsylvanica]
MFLSQLPYALVQNYTNFLSSNASPNQISHFDFPRPSFLPLKPITVQSLKPLRTNPCHSFLIQPLKCSVFVVSKLTNLEFTSNPKPFPAKVSRTIKEFSSVGTFSSFSQEGWSLGFGVRFAVDLNGTPILCLNESNWKLFVDKKCSLRVQLEQFGLRRHCGVHLLFIRKMQSLQQLMKVYNQTSSSQNSSPFPTSLRRLPSVQATAKSPPLHLSTRQPTTYLPPQHLV